MSSDPRLVTRFDELLRSGSRFDSLSSQVGQGWVNQATGMGTARDKTVYTSYSTSFSPLDVYVLTALYHGHDLAARIVDVIPEEGLRLPFTVEVPGNERAEKLLASEFKRLELREHLLMGWIWGRCFGGGATIVGAQDGKSTSEPLAWDRVRRPVMWLKTVDRRYLWPEKWYTSGPKNGQVERYWLNDENPGGGKALLIHESRLVLWPGAKTGQQEKGLNNSWDHSVLDRCYPALKAFETVYKGVELLVTEGPQAVYKVKGLFDKIVAGEEDALRTRFELIDLYRSMMRAIIIDADGSESFERQQVTYSGTPEILNQQQLRVSATAQIPMMVLFGQAPGGLGVTGDNDLRWFFDRTASAQLNMLAPRIERLATGILASNGISVEDMVVKFEQLWTPSAKEEAETRFLQAQSDDKYISNGTLLPEEVLLSRFKDKGKWSADWSAVDRATRIRMLKDLLDALENGELKEPENVANVEDETEETDETAPQDSSPAEAG